MSSPLVEAILEYDIGLIRSYLDRDARLLDSTLSSEECGLPEGSTPLHLAVHSGDPEIVALLINSGAELDLRNVEGRMALHDSIECCFEEATKLLIEAGCEIDICAAAVLGAIDELEKLLTHDASLVHDLTTNLSPLGWAAFGNQPAAAEVLMAAGARTDGGELLCAASVGHLEVTRVLLAHGADPNSFNEQAGGTALHAAAGMKFTEDSTAVLRLLIESGGDPALCTTSGMNALEVAQSGAKRQQEAVDSGEDLDFLRHYDGVIEVLLEVTR